MRLVDIDGKTEGTFFRCLHDEQPDDPRMMAMRRQWYERYKDKGLRAKVLILDTGEVVGLCQYLPIEHSPFRGKDLLAILCIWVHGYAHHLGNRQGQGYGRFILEAIEADARQSGAKGVAVWGMDFPHWNPVSFYEHMGYERADQEGMNVLVWKSFADDAEPPKLIQPELPAPGDTEKVNVTAYRVDWCNCWIGACLGARAAVEGLEHCVDFREIETTPQELGLGDSTFIDGKPYRPDGPPFAPEELRADILKRYDEKSGR